HVDLARLRGPGITKKSQICCEVVPDIVDGSVTGGGSGHLSLSLVVDITTVELAPLDTDTVDVDTILYRLGDTDCGSPVGANEDAPPYGTTPRPVSLHLLVIVVDS